MDKKEAKRILQVYRSSLATVEDPGVRSALQLLEESSELQEYLAQEQAFDLAFTQKLAEVEPPASLHKRILEGASRPTVEKKVIWWKQSFTWSIAACLLILLAIGIELTKSSLVSSQPSVYTSFSEFLNAVTEHAEEVSQMEYYDSDLESIHDFLVRNNADTPRRLPDKMQSLKVIGCLSFPWKKAQVGVICFKGEKIYHLYIASRSQLAIEEELSPPLIQQFKDYATASWTDHEQIFILTVEGQTDDLAQLL